MMKKLFLYIFLASAVFLNAQDSYHNDLIAFLKAEYNIENPSFVTFENEAEFYTGRYVYGNIQVTDESADNLGFTQYSTINVSTPGNNAWDAGMGVNNQTIVQQDDAVIIHFWAKSNSPRGSVNAFAEDAITFEKEYFSLIEFTPDWTEYFLSFKATKTYDVGAMAMGFHLATEVQNIDIGGFTALNYGPNYPLDDLPSSFSPSNYGGNEADAAWRAKATDRIENLRKANLDITVLDQNGSPLEGVEVKVAMEEHEFGFGTAFAMSRFPEGRQFNQTYIDKILNLDGKGHGFNVGVNENALKWNGWEEEWIGTPAQTKSAIEWISHNGIDFRGHVLVWPGYGNLPSDISGQSIDYINDRIENRLTEMLTDPVLSSNIAEWDILNEITTNRDLEMLYQGQAGYSNGRELYQEIIAKAKDIAPNKSYYVNDYIVLSGGGSSNAVVNRYKGYLDEMAASSASFDGIGFQCHIGSIPTSIDKIESTLNDFYDRYNVRMKITEFDIEPSVDDDTAAKYTSDFLTMIFSHPGVDAFIMWGFWDNNHWKNNALMFNSDWSLKPSGQAFIDKVFGEWWTDETLTSDANGQISSRAFKGSQKVTISYNGAEMDTLINLTDDVAFDLQTDFTSATQDPVLSTTQIFPNPVIDNQLTFVLPEQIKNTEVTIRSIDGRLVQKQAKVKSRDQLRLDVDAGVYIIHLKSENRIATQKIVVFD